MQVNCVTYIEKTNNMKETRRKFMHYAFQTLLYGLGLGTAGAIVFTFVTMISEL